MSERTTRREAIKRLGAAAAGLAVSVPSAVACNDRGVDELVPKRAAAARVAIAREDALTRGSADERRELLQKLLDASLQKLTGAAEPTRSWAAFFSRKDRVGIKVNTLGLATNPLVVDAVVAGLLRAGVPQEHIVIWDRFDVELERAGFKLNRSGRGVQCRGTDGERIGRGYERDIEVSGQIGSCFSRIVARDVNALISVPVLKDHNLAGVSLGMKNFYGAIHNPNKYHDDNCNPYVADVVSHRYIAPKWRLTVCDGTRAQYHNGPGPSPGYTWPFNGLIVSADFVAADAVGAALLEAERQARGLPPLAKEGRPPTYIATAGDRGLGEADVNEIERIEV